jgi:two-component system chemotaxis response regulator CheB
MQNLQYLKPKKVVLIGASTGGPSLIQKIILSLDRVNNCSVVVAQHMAEGFIDSFGNDLNKTSKNEILIVSDNIPLESNKIYFCKNHTTIKDNFLFKYKNETTHFNPDINILFNSFANLDIQIMCVILTGIGDDGVEGCIKLNKNNNICITQTAKSAIVDGMPSQARERVKNIKILSFEEIIKQIKGFCNG